MRSVKLVAVLISIGLLVACTNTHTPKVSGEVTDPINYRSVKLMERPPMGAEEVATLSTNYALAARTTDDEKLEGAINRLRLQAGNLGADILVINDIQEHRTSGVVTGAVLDTGLNSAIPAAPSQIVHATAYRSKQ
ncbi:MAG TPA: hypothetical protein VFM61_04945 [Pseudidiomarina sp.]|nr:hypothetical protein [Pseudidiomarina sp.]